MLHTASCEKYLKTSLKIWSKETTGETYLYLDEFYKNWYREESFWSLFWGTENDGVNRFIASQDRQIRASFQFTNRESAVRNGVLKPAE